MIRVNDKAKCSGCWACQNVCPMQCIDMVEDEEGFHYPKVDVDSCIECHKCEKACPELKPRLDDHLPLKSYVVQQKDPAILRQSTSGGFFSAIAKYTINQSGVVFGAAFDQDMILHHQAAESLKDCAKFRGSKYVQSLVGETYRQMEDYLKRGRQVVFSGTPCQIAGLNGFLGNKKYENLITVDVVCRGTPTPRLLKKYLSYYSGVFRDKVTDYRSRDKHYGYDYSTATIFFEDSKNQYHKGKESDLMLGLYFKNLISRPSCYQCHFKTINRHSDITIFDCWNAPAVFNEFSRKGATNVFIHTKKGLNIFDKLKPDFVWAESETNRQIENDGVMIKHCVPENPMRQQFFHDLHLMSIPEIERKYYPQTFWVKTKSFMKKMLYQVGLWGWYLKMK